MKQLLVLLTAVLTCIVASAQHKWEYLPNVGLDTVKPFRFEDIYFTDYKTGFAVNLDNRLYKTTDGGSTWTLKNDTTQEGGFRSIEFLDDGKTGIAGGFAGMVARTEDGGETWTNIAAAIPDTATDLYRHGICGISHYKDNFYAVGVYGSKTAHFYRSRDKGLTWTTIYPNTILINGMIDVVFQSEDTGFVCGTKSGSPVVLKTTDGGKTWSWVFYAADYAFIWKLQFLDKKHGFGAIQRTDTNRTVSMIKTVDGGNTWSMINTPFKSSDMPLVSLHAYTQACAFATPDKGWLGGYYGGLVQTLDGGATWDTLHFGRGFNRIFVMDSTHIYAGGKSVYRYGSDFTVGLPELPGEMKSPHTLQLSPNPTKGKLNISLDLGTRTNVLLQVMQVDSRKVWEIHRERMNPGHYDYIWNDPLAAPGNYLLILQTDEIPTVLPFTLTR